MSTRVPQGGAYDELIANRELTAIETTTTPVTAIEPGTDTEPGKVLLISVGCVVWLNGTRRGTERRPSSGCAGGRSQQRLQRPDRHRPGWVPP
ncbi:MAG: hypothetical protein ACYCXA_10575 [Actinomycetes bacterium]